jgi:hypothetical protein
MENRGNVAIVAVIATAFVLVMVALFVFIVNPSKAPLGSVTRDTLRCDSLTYTQFVASTAAAKAVASQSGRTALRIQNVSTSTVYAFLQATSTDVAVRKGIQLKDGETYTSDFFWPGEVWMIAAQNGATTTIQECR